MNILVIFLTIYVSDFFASLDISCSVTISLLFLFIIFKQTKSVTIFMLSFSDKMIFFVSP